MGGDIYKFAILKNYPSSCQYEVAEKNKGPLDAVLQVLGLKK